ncbi:DUF5789 family protein [Halorarum salinum]|uniref:DUF2795 domain-containing protein n=1 Tax=Halorarum salinum TaxID=2743089 RepID=A0A7D5QJT4_9EURY|nr:hypothetical protein [Halobaculum salinum]QLG64222.1 hypothetical protein HUG12_20780 [Halobaculum salinum]
MAPDDVDEREAREKRDGVQDAAERRQSQRAESVEDTLEAVRADLGTHQYPVNSEDLAAYYADDPTDLPNETESLGSAFGRLDRSFEDPDEAYEALVSEFEEGRLEGRDDDPGGENPTWDEGRATGPGEDAPEREDEAGPER